MNIDGEEIDTRPKYLQGAPAEEGVRMISPAGTMCLVPQENVEAARSEGFKQISDEDLARMFNRMFLTQKFFEQKHPKITNWRMPRGRGRW